MSSDAVNVASLVEAVRGFYRRGWTPATSSNFSVRSADHEHRFLVTRSGIDKELIQTSDLLLVDMDGKPVLEGAPKPSAETLIHSALYKWNAGIGAIYHTHSPSGAALSLRHRKKKVVEWKGLEILKGFAGIKTHESRVLLPLFPNTQDMAALSDELRRFFPKAVAPFFGLYLAGHGLYTWGENPAEAKRHMEVWEYLFEVKLKESS